MKRHFPPFLFCSWFKSCICSSPTAFTRGKDKLYKVRFEQTNEEFGLILSKISKWQLTQHHNRAATQNFITKWAPQDDATLSGSIAIPGDSKANMIYRLKIFQPYPIHYKKLESDKKSRLKCIAVFPGVAWTGAEMFLFWLGMTALNDVFATEDGISKARGRQKWTGSATLDFSLFQWLNWLVKKGIQRLFFLQSISLYLKPKWAWPLRIRISLDSEFYPGSGIFCFASGTAKN